MEEVVAWRDGVGCSACNRIRPSIHLFHADTPRVASLEVSPLLLLSVSFLPLGGLLGVVRLAEPGLLVPRHEDRVVVVPWLGLESFREEERGPEPILREEE